MCSKGKVLFWINMLQSYALNKGTIAYNSTQEFLKKKKNTKNRFEVLPTHIETSVG